MKRVGVLHGGFQPGVDEKSIPLSQWLKIARYNELSPYNSSTAYSDNEGFWDKQLKKFVKFTVIDDAHGIMMLLLW